MNKKKITPALLSGMMTISMGTTPISVLAQEEQPQEINETNVTLKNEPTTTEETEVNVNKNDDSQNDSLEQQNKSEESNKNSNTQINIPTGVKKENFSNNTVSPQANDVASVTIGGVSTGYSDLATAFNNIKGQTATITILQDCNLNEVIRIDGGDITVYGEGKTITQNDDKGIVIYGGTLNVHDFNYCNRLGIFVYGGTFNFFSGNIDASISSYGPENGFDGTVNIYGGTIGRVNSNWKGDVNYIPNSITMKEPTLSMAIGSNHQLVADVNQNPIVVGGNKITILPAWSSSAEEVVSVDDDGNLTAHSIGTAIITASAGGKSATCTVTVTKATQNSPDTSKLVEKYRDNDSMALQYEFSDGENINNLQFAYVEGENAALPSDSEWKNVTSEGMMGIGNLDEATPYTIFLRFGETEDYSASDIVSKVFYTRYSGVSTQINYSDEKMTGLLSNKEYYINLIGIGIETITSDNEGHIAVNEKWMGKTIYIALKSELGSQYTEVKIPSRPDTPTKLKGEITGKNDCKIAGLEDNISYEISSNNGQTWNDANVENGEITGLSLGTYQVRVKASDKSFASLPATVTIEKSDSSIAFKEDFNLSKTYDGKQVTIDVNEDVVTTGSTGNVSFVYEEKVNGAWQKLSSAPSGAGTYRVTANLAEDTNYKGASVTKEFIIYKAQITVGFIQTNIDKEYDGKPAFVGTKQSGSSNVATKTWYELDKDGTWIELEEAPANAGSYKVVATVKGNDNYNGTEAEMTFVIRKAQPSYTLPTDLVIKQGDDLSTVSLPKGFTWIDDAQTADVIGTQSFQAVFTPEDTTNYKTVEVEIRVEVVPAISQVDKAPVIHAEDKTLTVGDTFDAMKGVTATDAEDGDLTDKIVITKNTVDTSKAGKYTVVYEVTDSHGTRVVRTIYVTVQQKTADTNKKDSNKDSAKDTAQTSTQTNVMAWSVLGIASLGALLAVLFKRKHQ